MKVFRISHDPQTGLVWWGSGIYFLDVSQLVAQPAEAKWYAAEDQLMDKPRFVWKVFRDLNG